jgi:CO/xanthine dehydrogenase Mo-binding subunit
VKAVESSSDWGIRPLGTKAAAAAIANATGKRLRAPPFAPERVKQALA